MFINALRFILTGKRVINKIRHSIIIDAKFLWDVTVIVTVI